LMEAGRRRLPTMSARNGGCVRFIAESPDAGHATAKTGFCDGPFFRVSVATWTRDPRWRL
jgi:hypothetical protein